MKRHNKLTAGVTLLEIMLVLAIAAMIIVMSVKYYQSASTSQSTNAAMQSIQALTAAADGIAQGDGTYTEVKEANIQAIAGTNTLNLPWGTTMSLGASTGSYTVSLPSTPPAVCTSLKLKLQSNPHYSGAGTNTCGTTAADFKYNYVP